MVGDIAVASGATVQFGLSGSYTYNGVVSGAGGLSNTAIGTTLILNGANTYTGTTRVNLATTEKQGANTLTLDGANTYTGTTTVTADTLMLGTGSLAAATGLVVNGGTFDLNGKTQTVAGLAGTGGTVALGTGTLTTGGAGSHGYGGTLTGTGALVKQGTGTQTLTGANAYSGGTTVNAGTLTADLGRTGRRWSAQRTLRAAVAGLDRKPAMLPDRASLVRTADPKGDLVGSVLFRRSRHGRGRDPGSGAAAIEMDPPVRGRRQAPDDRGQLRRAPGLPGARGDPAGALHPPAPRLRHAGA